MLELKDALRIIERIDGRKLRIPFSVTFCTSGTREIWHKYKKLKNEIAALPLDTPERAEKLEKLNKIDIGGEIITLENTVLSGVAPISKVEKNEKSSVVRSYSPNHSQNKTRNFKILNNKFIRKAHIKLILKVNNQEVLY